MSRTIRVAHVTSIDRTLTVLLLGQLRRLRKEGFEVAGISAPGEAVAVLEAEGIRHIPWRHVTRSWSPGADMRAFAELASILRRERFDLVHAHNPKPGIMVRAAARLVGVPCVVNTVHGFYATPEDRPARRLPIMAMEWLAARCSNVELYQSEEDLAWARRLTVAPEGKGVLLGNGTDVSRFDPSAIPAERRAAIRRSLGIPEGVPVVGTVGRLVAEKGYRELFEAAGRVRAAVPGTVFLVVGEADADKGDAIAETEIRAAPPNVIVTGWREDVPDLLALMDVFVLASWREGVPRSAIEAASMGRPLVLTNIRGCREVAGGGDHAILVPPRDPETLAGAIVFLLRNPGLRERLGGAARAWALARFDKRQVEDLLVDSYLEVLARKGLLEPGVRAGGRVGEVAP